MERVWEGVTVEKDRFGRGCMEKFERVHQRNWEREGGTERGRERKKESKRGRESAE